MSALDLKKPFRRLSPTATPDVDSATGLATFIFNDESVGRDGHIVRNAGIRIDNYKLNPVILFGHLDTEPPVGRAVDIDIASPSSKITVEFTPRSLNPFGAMIGDLVKARYLNAVSESWQPVKAKRLPSGDGYDFTEVDLLEISIVCLPSLPSALATARSRGIDTTPMAEWTARALDRGPGFGIDRGDLLMLRRAAGGRSTAYSIPYDDGQSWRARVARDIAERTQRLDIALRLRARGESQLPAAAREALEVAQRHHERAENLHRGLSRQLARVTDSVTDLASVHRQLARAIRGAGVKDHAVTEGMAALERCSRTIDDSHDGSVGDCQDLGAALGSAKDQIADVIDGLSELDEA